MNGISSSSNKQFKWEKESDIIPTALQILGQRNPALQRNGYLPSIA